MDIDGFGRKDEKVVGVIGGFLGQLIMVLNTVAKHYQRLDVPVKSSKSQRTTKSQAERPKTGDSKKTESAKDGDKEEAKESIEQPPAPEPEHQILAPAKIQRFLYDYIAEKLKVEKLSIQVDPRAEIFMNDLPVPLELNHMRTMKEPNNANFRQLLREKAGGIVMNLIRDNQALLGLDPYVFDLAFESFWDLYTLRGHLIEVSPKKLQNWINKIRLQTNPMTGVPERHIPQPTEEGEEAKEPEVIEAQEPYDPISAIVRVRIAKKQPEPIEDDDGNVIEQEIDEKDLEDMPIDDKVLTITAHNGEQGVFVIN